MRPGRFGGGLRADRERGDALFYALGCFVLRGKNRPGPHIPRGETAASRQGCRRLDASGDLFQFSTITQCLSPSFAGWTSDPQPFV